jgi:pyruvate-formate lyase-activating enzyme
MYNFDLKPCFPREVEADVAEKLRPKPEGRAPLAPFGTELIKETRSICPTCFGVIEADVAVEDGAVWMYKRCPEHGFTKGALGPNPDFYRATMNTAPIRRMPFKVLIIPATHRCNLKCRLCFVPQREKDNLTLDGIKEIIDRFEGPCIAISGGEPTLREDLPDIIRYARSTGRRVEMLTNAIRLAEDGYAERLAEAGLQHILFSFNGFNDRTYRSVNRRPLLDVKLTALENCVRAGLDIVLSPTIFRDLNEGDIGPLIQMALELSPSVSQLRIRGACRVGTHGVFAPLSSFELFQLVAKALGRDVKSFTAELDREGAYHSAIQFNMLAAFRLLPNGGNRFVGWNSGPFSISAAPSQQVGDLVQKARLDLGDPHASEAEIQKSYRMLEIHSWSWPDLSNLDFQEIWSHDLLHLYDNRVPMNFFEAVLRANDL